MKAKKKQTGFQVSKIKESTADNDLSTIFLLRT